MPAPATSKNTRLLTCPCCRHGKLRTPETSHLPRRCLSCRAIIAALKTTREIFTQEAAQERKAAHAKKFRARRVSDRVAFNMQEWHTQQ